MAVCAAGVWYWKSQQGMPAEVVESSYAEPVDRFVAVKGAEVRIREQGPPNAPAIVLLHGFTFSLESWDQWAEDLSSDYRVIRYDLLGHGLTGPDPKERYAPMERARFLGDVLEALEIEKAIIGGNSLGGLAAWRFAAMSPDRVEALLLVSPGAYPINGVGDEPAPVPGAVAIYLRTVPEAGVRYAVSQIYAPGAEIPEERIQEIGDMMRREGNGEAMVKSLKEFTLPDPEPELRSIIAPTLILWGENDQVITLAQGERLSQIIPNARLITYPGVGHVAHEEVPQQSVADVRTFLTENGLEK